MAGLGSNLMSFIGIVGVACLLIGTILFLNLVQKAFDRDGIIWGFIAMAYPPGTYVYCRKNWLEYRTKFITISALICVACVALLLVRFL